MRSKVEWALASRWLIVAMIGLWTGACADAGSTVVFYRGRDYRFPSTERATIERIVRDSRREVRQLLPALAGDLTVRVRPERVANEFGYAGSNVVPNVVYWSVDPMRAEGVQTIAEAHLRPTLYHEFYHLVRGAGAGGASGAIERMVSEGLATAFERDFSHADVPWGAYPPDVENWLQEALAKPDSVPEWMMMGSNGRRWFGYKVGTYLADRAMRRTGRTAADLVSVPSDQIIALAQER